MAQQAGQLSPDGMWVWNGTDWVPNTLAPAQPLVPWARPYESPRFRSMWATIFLLANIVALFVGVLLDYLLLVMLAQEEALRDTQVVAYQALGSAFLVIYYGTIIPAFVFVSMWVHRIVRNMPALGSPDARWSPSGAVWRSFMPIFNFVHPLWGTLDAWRASDPTQRFLDVNARKAIRPPMLFVGWWALWLIGSVMASIGEHMSNSDDVGTLTAGTWIGGLSSILFVGAAALIILVMRQVTERQDRKNELIATGQLA